MDEKEIISVPVLALTIKYKVRWKKKMLEYYINHWFFLEDARKNCFY